MKPRCYLETTIPSYLTAWPSRDLVIAAHQQITREWWQKRRGAFEIFISEIVLREVGRGDEDAVKDRMNALAGVELLRTSNEAIELADKLARALQLPKQAVADGLHIAIAATNGIDFLLTWNCRHIANAAFQPLIGSICRAEGVEPPVICTPEELLEE
jgi:predicted nucleic acid-binding protein